MIKLPILSLREIEDIHNATLRVLSETGILLKHPKARDLLQAHGAKSIGDRILIPEDLVMDRLSFIPPTVKLQGREPDQAITLGNFQS